MSDLQKYLKDREIVFGGLKKAELDLIGLCEDAERLGLEIDLDGLLECRSNVINHKLQIQSDLDLDSRSNTSVACTFRVFF